MSASQSSSRNKEVSVNDDIIDFNEIPEADRTNFLIDLTNGFFNLSLIPEEKQEEIIRRLEVAFNKKGSTGDAADKHPNTIKLELYRAEITTNTIPLSMSQGADGISFVEHQRRITKLTHQDHDFTSERIPDQKNHHVKEPIKPSTKPTLDNSKEKELGIARKELREAEMIIQKQDTKNAQLLEWENQNKLLVENMAKDHATSLQSKNMEIANLRNSSITDLASLERKYESLIEVAVHILGRKKELSKPGNLRNSPLIEEGNSAAHSGRCLADLQRMEIKPMDGDSDWFENGYGVTVEGAQSEFETTFQKIKTQINESLPAEGETDEDDACIMEALLLKDPVAKILLQEVCSKWVAAVDRDQTTRKEIRKDP
ncbi:hypothetical protein ACHAP3_007997 [Botrytis cinerea]